MNISGTRAFIYPFPMNKWLTVFAFLILLSACATVKVPMQVTHPAEVNMSAYKRIAIGEVNGNAGAQVLAEIKDALYREKYFEVADRTKMDAVLAELKLNYSDLAATDNQIKLGKLLPASALAGGNASSSYQESVSSRSGTCRDSEGKEYKCTHYTRTGTVSLRGGLDVIDIQSGRIIGTKPLNCTETDNTYQDDGTPPAISEASLLNQCVARGVTAFARMVQPWHEEVEARFKKDSDIPDLEKGINQIKIGENEAAIRIIRDAISASEMNPKIKPKVLALGYWNLGLIYEYTWEFDKAESNFKKAFALYADDDYAEEIKRVKGLRAEREKLKEQGVVK